MASQYPVNIVTRNGLALISESIATKKNLLFTRIVAGDGTLSDNTDISTMTDVLSPKLELNSTTGVNEGNGQYKIYATISNSKLDVGFFPREVGLYAKVEGGQEVLYSYTNGGNNVGYIPDKTTPIDSEIYKITTVIGNAKNVSLVLKDETFATLLDLNLHNTATDAHANLFNQFLPLAGGTMAGDLNVLNKALTDNSRSAASTKFVRDLLNSYMTKGQVNFSNFKTAMAGAVEYDYSNPNAWWRKEPDGLIIQGGATGRPANNAATANFAIAFNNTDYIIIPVGVIDASDSKFSLTVNVLKDYKTANSCTFRTSDAIAPACYYVAFSRAN